MHSVFPCSFKNCNGVCFGLWGKGGTGVVGIIHTSNLEKMCSCKSWCASWITARACLSLFSLGRNGVSGELFMAASAKAKGLQSSRYASRSSSKSSGGTTNSHSTCPPNWRVVPSSFIAWMIRASVGIEGKHGVIATLTGTLLGHTCCENLLEKCAMNCSSSSTRMAIGPITHMSHWNNAFFSRSCSSSSAGLGGIY